MPELQSTVSNGMRLVFTIFIVLLSSCFQNTKPELRIPHQKRDEIFTKLVNAITEKHGLEKLREAEVLKDDLEIRVWLFTDETDGFILKRIDNDWSAIALKGIDCKKLNYYPKDKTYELGKVKLASPKSGWQIAWKKLSEEDILNLPDSDEFFIDGKLYYVEINQNGIYRTYHYSNPDFQKSNEAKQMMKIGEIIANEFGLYNFKDGSLCLEK